MTTLDDLFTDRKRAAATGAAPGDRSAQSLDQLFAQSPRSASTKPATVDDAPALRALVAAPARTFQAGSAPKPKTIRRVRESRDWVTVVLALLAVVAVVVAAAVVARSMSAASPAANALDTLVQTEADLVNMQSTINRDIGVLQSDKDAGAAGAQALAAPLASFGDTADEAALATAETARQAYIAAATAIVVPEALAPYRRGQIDEDSLASVGTAIDSANEQLSALEPVVAEVETARAALTVADDTFAAALSAFTGSIPPFAALLVEDNPAVEVEITDAVTATASAVAAADLMTATGVSAISPYTDAVATMRDAQELAEDRARGNTNTNGNGSTGGSSGSNGGGSTGETGVEPPVVEPQPEPQPEPEPVPTDPGTPPAAPETGG